MGRLSEPPFHRIAIVGVGLIGGSIALAARRRWPAAEIVGIDRQPVLETARETRVIDRGSDGLAEIADAIGRLLLQLGRVEQAARVLRLMVADGAGSGPPPHGALGHYLECLYRLRRYAELREVCRRFAEDLKNPAVSDEIREAARLWAQGGEVRVQEDALA